MQTEKRARETSEHVAVTHLPLSVTEKTSRKPSPVLMYCSLMAPNSSCPAVSRTRERAHKTQSRPKSHARTVTRSNKKHSRNLFGYILECRRNFFLEILLRVCVFTLVVFVQQSALTVEPGRPFVNHTLLGIRVFNRGVIVGDKVRLRWGRERERGNCQ